MATIEPYTTSSGAKRYRVRYRTPDRRQTSRRGFTTVRDAKAFAATVEVDKMRGLYRDPAAGRITVGELSTPWLAAKNNQLAASSYHSYSTAWRVHVEPRWGDTSVAAVEAIAVQDWVSELAATRSRAVVTRALGVLAGICDRAIAERRITINPCTGLVLPEKSRKRRVYLTATNVEDIAARAENPLLVRTLAYTGLRWGEAIVLRPMDIELERGRIVVHRAATEVARELVVGTPKTPGSDRAVPAPGFLLEQIADRMDGLGPEGLLFPGPDGGLLRAPDVRRGWYARAVREAGVPRVTIHDLRHTAASLAVRAGASVLAVQRMLGHTSASMTLDRYSDLFDDDLTDLAARMDTMYRPACGQNVSTTGGGGAVHAGQTG
ncbi:MAG: site-specific integrase [Dietzia sp.]|nr:site-specific integrase [Dietzia sp.]